jgi:hypothetical protein
MTNPEYLRGMQVQTCNCGGAKSSSPGTANVMMRLLAFLVAIRAFRNSNLD